MYINYQSKVKNHIPYKSIKYKLSIKCRASDMSDREQQMVKQCTKPFTMETSILILLFSRMHRRVVSLRYKQGRIYRGGWGGSSPPYSWCINGNMGRVREKKRWRKEEKWRERGRRRDQHPLQSCSASTTGYKEEETSIFNLLVLVLS